MESSPPIYLWCTERVDLFSGTLVIGVSTGALIGYFVAKYYASRSNKKAVLPADLASEVKGSPLLDLPAPGDYKLMLIVRHDLKMGKGKIAAQCAHAAIAAVENAQEHRSTYLGEWRKHGSPKVVVKVDNEGAMQEIKTHAMKIGLTTSIVRDAGRTQVTPGSATVLAVGPGPSNLVDVVTANLKLL